MEKPKRSLARSLWLRAQPIDPAELVALERAGVIEKRGHWYRMLKPAKMPEHLMANATQLMVIDGIVAVRMNQHTTRVRAQAARLGVDWQGHEPR